jgi:hypothetical protein
LSLAARTWAVQPSESLLPATTKGYLASPNVEEVRTKFKQTQLGEMVEDEAMKPFVEDFKAQIRDRLDKAGRKLGLTWEDLKDVYAGEVALATIQPEPKDKNSHATALIVDITGRRNEADALLATIERNLTAQKGMLRRISAAGSEITVITLPPKEVERLVGRERVLVKVADVVAHFIRDDQLVVTDDETIAVEIAGRFGKKDDPTSLALVPAFQEITGRLAAKTNGAPQIKWFIEPFGYAEVTRAMAGGKRKRGTDLITVLRKQGFSAIQGVGGHIFLATGDEEILHRTFIYAPPVKREPGDMSKDKWNLAMRILDFPNSTALAPPNWVPQDIATYVTFHNRLQNSFWHSETLVDEYMGEKGVFKDLLQNLEFDPNGPKINLKRELIDQLGERVVVISDVKVPVDVKSERLIVAIEILRPAVVAKTLEKNFSLDPKAKKLDINGNTVWQIINEDGGEAAPLTVEGDGANFVAKEEEEVAEEAVLPNMALTVYNSQLVVATHVEFLEEVMKQVDQNKPLVNLPEYVRVEQALKRLGADKDSLRAFTRTDESYRGTYDLLRQGKLPEGETILARVLNNVLGSGKKDEVRKQEIDGSKLPPFEQVQKYLGPAGSYLHTEEDGWIFVGCLLKKQANP